MRQNDERRDRRRRNDTVRRAVERLGGKAVGPIAFRSALDSLVSGWRGAPMPESPIEDLAYQALGCLCAEGVRVDPQARVDGFRVDLMVSADAQHPIAIECDGAAFHSRDADRPREAQILRQGAVSRFYRLPGSLLHRSMEGCLAVIAVCDPWVFPKGSKLARLAQFIVALNGAPWTSAAVDGGDRIVVAGRDRVDVGSVSFGREFALAHVRMSLGGAMLWRAGQPTDGEQFWLVDGGVFERSLVTVAELPRAAIGAGA